MTNGNAPQYVPERAAAQILGMSVQTMRRWRLMGAGPVYRKFGGAVRYHLASLERWAESTPSGGGGTHRG
jgi:hypothetical protein